VRFKLVLHEILVKIGRIQIFWTRDSGFRTQADFNNFLIEGRAELFWAILHCSSGFTQKFFNFLKCTSSDDKILFLILGPFVWLNIGSLVLPDNFDDLGYFVRTLLILGK
jgi:hypothetical protein